MAIITISRGSYSEGKEVAEKVSSRLGYRCLSREVILDASDRYQISEIKMVKAIHDAPSILERFGHSKTAFVAYYQSALAQIVQADNVVYHGLAGHLLLKGIPHTLKVRIIAELGDRVRSEMDREKIPKFEAEARILMDDQERRKWTQSLYGVDPWDGSLYDIMIHIQKLTVDNAVDMICEAAGWEQFRTTEDSQRRMDDLVLASQIKASLIDTYPGISVICEYGNVLIYTKANDRLSRKLDKEAESLSQKIKRVRSLELVPGGKVPPEAI